MTDIADSMARYIDNIPDGAAHTCSDLCIKPSCLIVRGKQEIERLRYAIKLERGKTEKADADNDALRSRLADSERLREDERLTWDAQHKRQASMNAHLAALVTDAQEELRKCQQDAIQLQARLADMALRVLNVASCLEHGMSPGDCAMELRLIVDRGADSAEAAGE